MAPVQLLNWRHWLADEQISNSSNQLSGLTKRAPDVWESARFTGTFLASGFSYISSIVHARPPAGNADRWAAGLQTSKGKKKLSYRQVLYGKFQPPG